MPMPMDDWKTRKLQLKPGETKAAGPASVLLLVYAGAIDSPEVGRTFPLHGEEMIIGRSSDADIQVDRDSVSRRHARLQRQNDGWVVSDLQSTNGSYINDMPVREQRLLSGESLKIGNAVFKFLAGPNLEGLMQDEFYRIAVTDGLTQARNRRAFADLVEREIARSRRFARPLSLLVLDLDHIKAVNDAHGHLTGDHIIKEMARRIQRQMDRCEVLCRYDGTQFMLLLPEATSAQAMTRAEALRQSAASETFNFEGDRIPITASVGVVTLSTEVDSAHLIKVGVEQLLKAKKQGRNRVC